MNLKEYAEEVGISLAEAKEATGLTHWNQPVPMMAEPVKPVEDVFIETESTEEDTLTMEEFVEEVLAPVIEAFDDADLLERARSLQTGVGFKTVAYLQFVLDNKDELIEEYQSVKALIKRFVCAK